MIGVAEDDLGVEVVDQIPRQEAFDSGLRTTGMKTGVSMSPCAVCKIPARAPVCGQVA